MRASLLVAALWALPAAAEPIDWSKPPPLGPERSFEPPVPARTSLQNGIPVWVVRRSELPLVTVRLVITGAGSTHDPAGKAGLAGYVADLLDEGAGGLGTLELAERLERLGTTLRTWAEEDAAYVEIEALSRNLLASLELMGKVVTAPAFDAKEAERVREDRLTAIALRRDSPGAVAQLILEGAIHGPDTPYGHPALGYADDLRRATLDDVREFYRTRYATGAAALVIAGDMGSVEARSLLDGALGTWRPAAAPDAPLPPARPRPGRLFAVDRRDAEQSHVLVGAPGVNRGDPRAFAVEVLADALGGTFTSRLSRRLREELGYTYGARAYAAYHKQAGLVIVDTAVFTPATVPALREIERILGDVRKRGLMPDELDAAKHHLVRSLPELFDTNGDVVAVLADLVVTGLAADWLSGYARKIGAVTGDDVKAAAARLDPKRLRVVVVGDQAKVGRGLGALGYGRAVRMDPDGRPAR